MPTAPEIDLGALLWTLLKNYYQFGWPFLLLHIGVLLLSIWAWWGLLQEIRHLRSWIPGSRSRGSQATQILDQFIAESQELGAQGILVPITDFSDRLDSIVGGKVTELYERINLFLIVGIAGTLFGVFSFASQAASLLNDPNIATGERVFRLGETLSTSLANAFPVGFVGLVLMFLGQVGVSIWENRLKRTVAEATSRGLEQRTIAVRSQTQIVEETAERIEKALQPLEHLLEHLQETMAKHLTPVVDKLGERLDESLKLIGQQFGELQKTTSRFETAGKALAENVETLGKNTQSLDTLLADAPNVLRGLISSQAEQQKAMMAFQASLTENLQSIRAAQDVPAQVVKAAQEALQLVSVGISSKSAEMVAELKQRIAADYNHLFQRVEEQINLLNTSLRDTSDQLTVHLRTSAETLFEGARRQAATLDELIQKGDQHLQASLEASQGTISALVSMSRSAEDLPSKILETSQSALQEVVRAAVDASNQMAEGLKTQINASSDFLREQADDQAQALRDNLATTTQELLAQLSGQSAELFHSVKGQVEAVQTLVVQTTGQLQEINKAAKEAVEGLQGLREEAKGSLVASFAGMSEESGRLWKKMSDRFGRETQEGFGNLLQTTRESVREIRDSLGIAAKNWADLANNAETVIRDPIVQVLRSVGEEFQKRIRNLDNLMAQRYPEVVRDVGAFTRELQALLVQAEAVQRGLDRWAASVAQSQQEMEAARKGFLENLAQSIPQIEGPSGMASLLEKELGKQLVPVRSELSQMDQSLRELRQRRDPMGWLPPRGERKAGARPIPRSETVETDAGPAEESMNRPPELPEKPRTVWDRLQTWFPRWRR